MQRILKSLSWAAMFTSLSTAAFAQSATPTPTSLVESYKSWQVDCDLVAKPEKKEETKENSENAADKSEQFCTAHQAYSTRSKNNERAEVARFLFYYFAEKDEEKKSLVSGVRTTVNVSFEKEPELFVGEEALVKGKFRRCRGTFCFISFEIDDKKRKTLTEAKEAYFVYPLSNGQNFRITMSLEGLSDALAALGARNK